MEKDDEDKKEELTQKETKNINHTLNENETEKIEEQKTEKDSKEIIEEKIQTEEITEEDKNENENEEIAEEDNEVPKEEKKKEKCPKKAFVIISLIVIFLLIFSTIFAIMNIDNGNIIKGTYIEKVDISNMEKEEASKIINEKIKNIEDIELTSGDYNTIIKLEDIGIEISAENAINKAINLGKTNNIIIDNYTIIKTQLFKTKLDIDIKINDEKFEEMTKKIQVEIPNGVRDYSYEIEDENLIITNGKEGKSIDEKNLKKAIIENVKEQFNNNIETLEIPTNQERPNEIDLNKIYEQIHKEAKDAYIIDDPFELHKEENGVDFKISMDEAKSILEENKEVYTIPLKITKPKVLVKDLGDKLFKQTLSKYTTIYDAGNTSRASNIALATKTINGTVLLPGETFSYNGKIGNTTKEKGYKLGGAYIGGKVVPAYGGGICQVSSTLYNAVLYANLGIIERYNHSYSVSYVPAGRDATVSYGGKDFKFKNTRKYPIKIEANAKNGVIGITIKGIKEEKEYEVILSSNVISTTPNNTTYEQNASLPEGKQKVIQIGHDGCKSIAYKTIKYEGKIISKTLLSKDTYQPMNKIVQVGSKKSDVNAEIKKDNIPTTNNQTVQEQNIITNNAED